MCVLPVPSDGHQLVGAVRTVQPLERAAAAVLEGTVWTATLCRLPTHGEMIPACCDGGWLDSFGSAGGGSAMLLAVVGVAGG